MQRIVLPQSVFSLPTSVGASVNEHTNTFACNSVCGWKQSLVVLRLGFDPLLHCLFTDASKFVK